VHCHFAHVVDLGDSARDEHRLSGHVPPAYTDRSV
jgi:hypothetical protein